MRMSELEVALALRRQGLPGPPAAQDPRRLHTGPQLACLDLSIVRCRPAPLDEANQWVTAWGHRLGPVHRPFGPQGLRLEWQDAPLAVAIAASSVSNTVAGYRCQELVECARLCAREPWANRVMLRLWRECCAPLWPYWPVQAAMSYSHNAMHTGHLYRLDGWTKVTEDAGSMGGGAWGRLRYATEAVLGKKTLWIWRYADRPTG